MTIIATAVAHATMKRCQNGVPHGKHAYDDLHGILAECYGTIGALVQERDMLRTGDTCARVCEGQAYRFEASEQKRRADALEAELKALRGTADMAAVECAVREFHARAVEIERVVDVMNGVLSMEPEGDLNAAIWALIGGYKDALGQAYGIDGWLEWWWLECRLGNNPLQAGLTGDEMRTIATVDDLVRVICDHLARPE